MRRITNKYKTYLIGAIEKTGNDDVGRGWRDHITPRLEGLDIFVFDPLKLEGSKVNLNPEEFLEKLHGYKRSGHWEKFMEVMNKIWHGEPHIDDDGQLSHTMGDKDYVHHSNFLVGYLAENDDPVGTIYEMGLAKEAGIPIYLITKINKTVLNSSLLWLVLASGGQVFTSFNQLIEFLEKKYV